jgi:hypothetical protein
MFLGLLDPHPDPQYICAAPDPDNFSNKQKNWRKTFISTVLRHIFLNAFMTKSLYEFLNTCVVCKFN